jgi:hypothetical protein
LTFAAVLKQKKTQLIRRARDGSAFIAPYSIAAITSLTTGTPTNEVQTVTITGTPTGGTFTLTFNGRTTTAIAYNAASSAVQTALQALSSIGAGNATVTGSAGGPYTVTFTGGLAATNVPPMTATAALTGGTTPGVTIATPTPGVSIDLAALPAGYEDIGYTSTDGISYGRTTQISEVRSWGEVDPTRSDMTSDTITMTATAQETKLLTIGLQTGADATGLLANSVTGEFQVAKPSVPGLRYYRVLGIFVDRDDFGREIYIARFMPRARITGYAEQKYSDANDQPVDIQLTFTGFNDSTLGYSHLWLFGGPGWQPLLADMNIPQA